MGLVPLPISFPLVQGDFSAGAKLSSRARTRALSQRPQTPSLINLFRTTADIRAAIDMKPTFHVDLLPGHRAVTPAAIQITVSIPWKFS